MRFFKIIFVSFIYFNIFLNSSSAQTKDLMIIFSNSTLSNLNSSKVIVKSLFESFLKIDKFSKISLLTYDDRIYKRIDFQLNNLDNLNDLNIINAQIDGILPGNNFIDLDRPAKYLTEMKVSQNDYFVIFISNGLQIITDEKKLLLSEKIIRDPRYHSLNEVYTQMQSTQTSIADTFNKISLKYISKNESLFFNQAHKLKEIFANNLIVIDTSGKSQLLQRWSTVAQAQYLPFEFPENNNYNDSMEINKLTNKILSLLHLKTSVDTKFEKQINSKSTLYNSELPSFELLKSNNIFILISILISILIFFVIVFCFILLKRTHQLSAKFDTLRKQQDLLVNDEISKLDTYLNTYIDKYVHEKSKIILKNNALTIQEETINIINNEIKRSLSNDTIAVNDKKQSSNDVFEKFLSSL
ncbi:MAG: hypothetical protein HQK49_05075 [Oligoflexia bacterium]|nr:hypothetical protein [Oligoflexia bacterium]